MRVSSRSVAASLLILTLAPLSALLQGCPGGKTRQEIRYEVREMTPEEREARRERMDTNVHHRDQLFRHIRGIRRERD